MDHDILDTLLDTITALLAPLGVIGTAVAWIIRGRVEARRNARTDKRDDFSALSHEQGEAITRLTERLDEALKRLDDVEQQLTEERRKRLQLEALVERFRVLSRLIRQAIVTLCENGATCPLTALLDDWDRETGAPAAAHKE